MFSAVTMERWLRTEERRSCSSLLLGADSVAIADVDTCKEETFVVVAFVFKDNVELLEFSKMVAIVFIVHQLATSRLL